MALFFVEAGGGADDLDLFVRAEHPRQAFEFWRNGDYVQTMDPELASVEGDVSVWAVPDADGPLGPVDWTFGLNWCGLRSEDFPLTMED